MDDPTQPAGQLEMVASPSLVHPIAVHLKQQIGACLEQAMVALRGKRPPSPASVHHARKCLKQARATLRLLREVIGERGYRKENRRLREVALSLSHARDAQVVLTTFDKVVAAPHSKRALKALRAQLTKSVHRAQRAVLDTQARGAIVTRLESEQRRIARYGIPARNIDPIKGGIKRIYRKGRKSLVQARAKRTDESLHEARKGGKYLSLALGALQVSGILVRPKVARHAQAVGHLLGVDHDLAVLTQHLDPLLDDPTINRRKIRRTISKTRKRMRAKAFRAARRLYERKPGAFVSHSLGFDRFD